MRTEPGEAALVAQLFDWYLELQPTVYQLARRLTDLGVPTPRGGPRWNTASVRGILRNPSYAGRALSNRTQVAPVVSAQAFAQVQAKLDANQQGAARNTRHEYLLRALISCGACRLGCTGRQTGAGCPARAPPSAKSRVTQQ